VDGKAGGLIEDCGDGDFVISSLRWKAHGFKAVDSCGEDGINLMVAIVGAAG
jgi:hypothetical protein